jgi:hypothetical protein
MFSLFIDVAGTLNEPVCIPPLDIERIGQIVDGIPGVLGSTVYYRGSDPSPWDMAEGALPSLWIVARFPTIESLEAAASCDGPLSNLNRVPCIEALPSDRITHQAMLSRAIPLPATRAGSPLGGPAVMSERCAYIVAYEGEPEDEAGWLTYYLDQHSLVVARLPRLLRLEVCTRIDWRSGLPWPRSRTFLRSTVNFASDHDLKAAFSSSVRLDIRADAGKLPAFTGDKPHLVMQALARP